MNAKTTLLLIVVLTAIFAVSRYLDKLDKPPLQADIITLDTSAVSIIEITNPAQQGKLIRLQREQNGWIVSNGRIHVKAQSKPVEDVLHSLYKVTTDDLAAKRPEEWDQYGLSDEQAIRIRIYIGDDLLEDFLIGSRNNDTHTSWLRLAGEPEVYAVSNTDFSVLRRSFQAYRCRTILSLADDAQIEAFQYLLSDTTLRYRRYGTGWQLNDSLLLDPAPVNRYLQGLRKVGGEHFADDFDDNAGAEKRLRSLWLQVVGRQQPLVVNIYVDSSRQQPYILHSSQNPSNWFAVDSTLVFARLFRPTEHFLPVQQSD